VNPVRRSQIWYTEPVSCSNECATTESYTRKLLESSYSNIPSCSWPNHSSDVVKWSSYLILVLAWPDPVAALRDVGRRVSYGDDYNFMVYRFIPEVKSWSDILIVFFRLYT